MNTIVEIFNWLNANKMDLINVISYIIAGATIIVQLTPSKKDDAVLTKIVKFIGKYIALNK